MLIHSALFIATGLFSLFRTATSIGCQFGEYYSSASQTCIPCHYDCLTCTGSSNNCTSCEPPLVLVASRCITCDPTCETCSGTGPTSCTSCAPPRTFDNGACVIECEASCETCSGPTATECLTCLSGKYLSDGQCQSCDPSCLTCNGADSNACTSCTAPAILIGGECVICNSPCATCPNGSPDHCLSCASGTYLDTSLNTCLGCDDSCLTCNGAGPSAYTSCTSPTTLVGGYCVECDSPCATCDHLGCLTCVSNAFRNGATCELCDSSCLTCSAAGPLACTTCQPPAVLTTSGACVICHSTCLTCDGNSASDCLSCDSNKYFSSGQCLDCDSSCETCNGPGSGACTSCTLPLELYSGVCSSCPLNPTIDFKIQAKSFVYLCETMTVQLTDVTSTPYNVAWRVTSSHANSTNEDLIAGMLNARLPIPPMTFLHNTHYTLEANVSDNCAFKVKTFTIDTVKYPTYNIANPASAFFLSWWENEGTLLGCEVCSAPTPDDISTCLTCSTPLQPNTQGRCVCQDQSSYIDLTNFPQVSCQSKSNSQISWYLKQQFPHIQMQANFTNGFAFSISHLKYTASTIGVTALNDSITIQDYSAISNKRNNITLSFTIPQDIAAGVTIGLTNLSEYNKLPFSPFLIQNPDITYQLPAITYLSPDTVQTLIITGTAAASAMQAQVIASTIIPAVTGGMSTTAMLLISFLAEVDIYKYINVPFPDNFNQFCEAMSADLIPNVFATLDNINHGDNPSSTIGKFKFWGTSATLLDNSYAAILKELAALGIILAANILTITFRKRQDLLSRFSKIRDLFMWNVLLSFYVGDYTELQLHAMIELRERSAYSFYTLFSLGISLAVVITFALLKIFLLYIVNRKHQKPILPQNSSQLRLRTEERTAVRNVGDGRSDRTVTQGIWREVPSSVAIITEDFVSRNAFTRNFFLIMLLQNFLMILLIFFFQNYGLAQAIVYTILTLLYVAIIAWQRPYKSKFQLVLLLINQISKVAMGIIAIMIGVNERTNSIPQTVMTKAGTALMSLIIVVIGINLVIALLITGIELFQGVRRMVNKIRAHCLSKASKSKRIRHGSFNTDHGSINHSRDHSNHPNLRPMNSHRHIQIHASSETSFIDLLPAKPNPISSANPSERVTRSKTIRRNVARKATIADPSLSPENNRQMTHSKAPSFHRDLTISNISIDQSLTYLPATKQEIIIDKNPKTKERPELRRATRFEAKEDYTTLKKVKKTRIQLPFESP